MVSCMSSRRQRPSDASEVGMWSVVAMQVRLLCRVASVMVLSLTPVHLTVGAVGTGLAADHETSSSIKRDRERKSKIRARHDMRKSLLYTAHAVGERESGVREREVSGRKVRARTASPL